MSTAYLSHVMEKCPNCKSFDLTWHTTELGIQETTRQVELQISCNSCETEYTVYMEVKAWDIDSQPSEYDDD